MDDTLNTFRIRMKSRRLHMGITLKEIAEYIDVKEATVQRYESGNGIKSVPYDAIIKIATLLKCSPAYLIGWEKQDSSSILEHYEKLNDLGKQEAEKRVEELTYISKYTEPSKNTPDNAYNTAPNTPQELEKNFPPINDADANLG